MGDLRTALAKARADDGQELRVGAQKSPPALDIQRKAAAWAWFVHGLGKHSPVPNNTRVSRPSSRFKAEATRKTGKKWDPKQRLFDQYELSLIAKSFEEAAVKMEAKNSQSSKMKKKTKKRKLKEKEGVHAGGISCFAMLTRPLRVKAAADSSSKERKKSSGGSKADKSLNRRNAGSRKSTKVSSAPP